MTPSFTVRSIDIAFDKDSNNTHIDVEMKNIKQYKDMMETLIRERVMPTVIEELMQKLPDKITDEIIQIYNLGVSQFPLKMHPDIIFDASLW